VSTSVLTFFRQPKATNSSANTRKVPRQRLSGGSLQEMRMRSCSTTPLILTLSGRGGGAWDPQGGRTLED
jgi:hypothetical protein